MRFLKLFITLFHFNRTNWKAVALCFVTASVFWLFNALNKSYSTQLRLPLQLEYDQSLYAPMDELPKTLPINVSGVGWDLVRKNFGLRIPVLTIPLEQPAEFKKIPTTTLVAALSSQLGNLTINYIALDTLRISLDKRMVRKCKLVANASDLTYRNNSGRISPIVILPDSVELTGPEAILKPLSTVLEIRLPAKRIQEDYREEVEVIIPHTDLIRRNPPVVEIMFEVAPMAEISGKIRVLKPVLPWGMVLDQDSVACRLRVPQKEAEGFDWSILSLSIPQPLPALTRGQEVKILPSLVGLSPYASVSHIDSLQFTQH